MNDDCIKLTTYFGERSTSGAGFFADALLDLYGRHAIESSILLRGVQGFGLKHRWRSDQQLTMSEDLPMTAIAVDRKTKIDGLLDEVFEIEPHGLLTLERCRMLTGAIASVPLPEELHEATKLTIYVGRRERIFRVPTFVAVCDLLHRRGVDGASVLLGVDGTVRGNRERARFFDRNVDVPMMIIAVGAGERIGAVLPELGALLREPLITLERVRVCKRDGELIERPHALPGVDERGCPLWQKLMVYTSESALYRGRPIHRELISRLRRTDGTRGATALRGIWGFHGDHPPHGDRLFQLARRVPISTIIVDTPARIAAAFDIVDELTTEHGLVTTEMVPALSS
ncbi:MAG: DUF190 domain-containing protein, partial [Sciscionella sp.]